MTASEAREDAKALRTLASGTRAVAEANWSPRTEMFTGATARADRLDRAAVALEAYADGIDAPEFRPTSSDTNRLHRIRARLLELVPLDGTMSMWDDVQRLDRALADAAAVEREACAGLMNAWALDHRELARKAARRGDPTAQSHEYAQVVCSDAERAIRARGAK